RPCMGCWGSLWSIRTGAPSAGAFWTAWRLRRIGAATHPLPLRRWTMGLNFDGGKRRVEYRYAAIRNGVELCPIQAVGAPRITMQSTAEIKTSISGSFVVPEEVDFLTDTLRPYMVVD